MGGSQWGSMSEKLYTVREAAQLLGVSERDVIDLSEKGLIPAYKVGGVYLRFKKDHLLSMKGRVKPSAQGEAVAYAFRDKLSDFFYYNDFYLLSFLLISILVYKIFH